MAGFSTQQESDSPFTYSQSYIQEFAATSGMLNELRSGVITMANVGEGSLFIAVPSLLLGMLIFARHGVFKAIYRAQPFLVFLFIFRAWFFSFLW